MARNSGTYRASRLSQTHQSRYEPAQPSKGKVYPPEQKGRQESARRLRQMGKQAAIPEPAVVVGAGKDADPPPGLFNRLLAKVMP